MQHGQSRVATLLKWIAYMPALDKRASEEHRKWARRTETELQIYDCDHLCDKGECVENLLSAADAFTPMTPRQSSPAHAVVMRSMLLVLGAVLRSPGASVHAVRSKHAQRCLERLAQLTSIEDLGAAEVLLSFIKLLDEAGRVYACYLHSIRWAAAQSAWASSERTPTRASSSRASDSWAATSTQGPATPLLSSGSPNLSSPRARRSF